MTIKYVAIDSGKFATKAVTLKPDRTERLLVFRTKMEETNRASAQGTSFLVEYQGKKYILGEQAEVASSKSSKAELIHKVAVYTALARLVESGDEVDAAVGRMRRLAGSRQRSCLPVRRPGGSRSATGGWGNRGGTAKAVCIGSPIRKEQSLKPGVSLYALALYNQLIVIGVIAGKQEVSAF